MGSNQRSRFGIIRQSHVRTQRSYVGRQQLGQLGFGTRQQGHVETLQHGYIGTHLRNHVVLIRRGDDGMNQQGHVGINYIVAYEEIGGVRRTPG